MNTIQHTMTSAGENKPSRQMRRAAHFAPGGSIKIRFGGRMMLMVWRKRARVAVLLGRLLRRSLKQLALGAVGGTMVFSPSYAALADYSVKLISAQVPVPPLPSGGVVTSGTVSMNSSGNILTVNQSTSQAIVNWNSFNIDAGYKVKFAQPGATSSILNRVGPGPMSSIQGQLEANGKVWLINPAGIMIGSGATINVGGFVASTLQVSDSDFLANRLNFTGGAGAGAVSNNGAITALPGGSVYLVGASVSNGDVFNANATITTPTGKAVLAAGDTVTLTFADPTLPGIKMQVTGNGSVNNVGKMISNAGSIGLAGALVRTTGTLDVSSVSSHDGRIFLQASNNVRIDPASTIVTGVGGELRVTAPELRVETTTAQFDSPSYVQAGLLQSVLNAGGNVSLVADSGSNFSRGTISVVDSIVKSSGGDATLSLTANNSIFASNSISSTASKLNVALTANSAGVGFRTVNLSGAALDLGSGMLSVNGALNANGVSLSKLELSAPDLVTFSGANLLNANLSLPNVAIRNGAQLSGSGKLTATNLNWSGGTIVGGSTDPSYDITNLTMTGVSTLDGRVVNLMPGGVSNATSATLFFKNSGVLNNAGTLTVSDQTQLGYFNSPQAGNSVINNRGVINSTNTAKGISSARTANYLGGGHDNLNAVAFNNSGTINVFDGDLHVTGGGTHTGAFNVMANGGGNKSTLHFGVYNYDFNSLRSENIEAGSTFSESGINGGVATVDFSISRFNTTNLNTNVSLNNVAIVNGTLQGSGRLTATNLHWQGGAITGTSTADPAYDVTNLTIGRNAFVRLDGRTMNLVAGGTSIIDGGAVSLRNNAVLNNAGALTLSGGTLLSIYSRASESGVINNTGLINAISSTSNLESSSERYVSPSYIGSGTNGGAVTFNNTGAVKVQSGTLVLADPSAVQNHGQIQIDTGATLQTVVDLINAPGASITGAGSIVLNTSNLIASGGASSRNYTLINNGVIAPGSATTTGTLSITGNYTQGSTGEFIAKVAGASAGQHDQLTVNGATRLDGALTVIGQNGYAPESGDALNLIEGQFNAKSLGKFARTSLPDYLSVGYGLYEGAPVRLNYVAGGTNFFNNSAHDFDWANASNWSGNYTPVSVSDVLIDTGFTVQHASGADLIRSLTINANNGLNISGGSLAVSALSTVGGTLSVGTAGTAILKGGLVGDGTLVVGGGTVQLGATSSIGNLAMTGGTLSGATNLTVSKSFQQTGGALQFAGATVSALQRSGDLLVGGLTAASANLSAAGGAIIQSDGALIVDSLSTQSVQGTTLTAAANQIKNLKAINSGAGSIAVASVDSLMLGSVSNIGGAVSLTSGGTITQSGMISAAALTTSSAGGTILNGANQISSFSALNSDSGAIELTNTTRPGTLTLLDITNTAGGIAVDNTGAILTSGAITAAQGNLTLTAHSPITVNSTLTARDGISLNALPSTLGTDTVMINGALATAAGDITVLSGTNTTVSANSTLQVASGSLISFTALKGEVDLLSGATFIGAVPTILQSVSKVVAPPSSLPIAPSQPPSSPQSVATAPSLPPSSPTVATIDSLQKISSPFAGTTNSLLLLASSDADGSDGSATSGGKNNNASGSADDAKSSANKPAKSLPVCGK